MQFEAFLPVQRYGVDIFVKSGPLGIVGSYKKQNFTHPVTRINFINTCQKEEIL